MTSRRSDSGTTRASADVAQARFRSPYEAEATSLLGYAGRRVSRLDDAADVVAEVFTVAWRRIDEVPAGADARPWLYGVARNVLRNHRRGAIRHGRLTERLRSGLRSLAAESPPAADERLAIVAALERLSDDDRELLLLTNWEGFSPAEIAVALDVPPGTVRSRLHRARQQLRNELGLFSTTAPRIGPEAAERCGPSGHVEDSEAPLAADHEELR